MKILLAGDSTVTEQPRSMPYDPARCYCGWGQMLNKYLKGDVAVLNFAISGYTVEAFREKGQYDKLNAALEPGDYVMLQFGHNDQKLPHLRAEGGYSQGLKRYIGEIRGRGAVPVIVTPVARNSWRSQQHGYLDLLEEYAMAALGAAQATGTPALDLHKKSVEWICEIGREGAKPYFYPGDFTHPNDFGGYKWAGFVAELIRGSADIELRPLKEKLLPEGAPGDFAPPKSSGWLWTPKPRQNYGEYLNKTTLTHADALAMARLCGAWFVSTHVTKEPPLSNYYCAQENDYLPQGFPNGNFDTPISAGDFKALILASFAGRDPLTAEAMELELHNRDGLVPGTSGAQYILALEKLISGADETNPKNQTQNPPPAYIPAGS